MTDYSRKVKRIQEDDELIELFQGSEKTREKWNDIFESRYNLGGVILPFRGIMIEL